jgi:hypothetical protein
MLAKQKTDGGYSGSDRGRETELERGNRQANARNVEPAGSSADGGDVRTDLPISEESSDGSNPAKPHRKPIDQPLCQLHRLGPKQRRGGNRSVSAQSGGDKGGGE